MLVTTLELSRTGFNILEPSGVIAIAAAAITVEASESQIAQIIRSSQTFRNQVLQGTAFGAHPVVTPEATTFIESCQCHTLCFRR